MGLPEEGEHVSAGCAPLHYQNPGDRRKIDSKMGPNCRVLGSVRGENTSVHWCSHFSLVFSAGFLFKRSVFQTLYLGSE